MVKKKRTKSPQISLPEETYIEILTKLPVKALLKGRCICKLWCSLIDNTNFSSTHLINYKNNKNQSHLLVLEPPKMCINTQLCTVRNTEKFRKISKFKIDITWYDRYEVAGYINGLLCMKEYITKNKLYKILLWNPSIRKVFVLPPSFGSFEDQRFVVDCAFGFDHVINDYKVVVSFYNISDINIPKIIEIFTLSTCTWKNAKNFKGPYYWVQGGPKIFLNGNIYWLGIDIHKATLNGIISHFVSFNVLNESLKYIKLPNRELPNALGHERDLERFPINLAQSIALMEVFNTHSQIWVMEELENMEQSWTKRYTINLQLLHKCLYFKMDGDLFFSRSKGGVNSYNIYNEEIKVLVKSYKLSPVFTSVYMESLALHNGVCQGTLITFPSS